MSIETRGNDNLLVVSGSAVLVDDVGDAVLDRKNLDWICKRFPITVDEVFQCIEVLSDTNHQYKGGITLINRGSENVYFDIKADQNHFEVSELHDSVYQAIRQEIGDIEPDVILNSINNGGMD